MCFNRSFETNFEAPRGAKIINTKEGRDRCQNWLFPPDTTAYVQFKFCQRNIDACPPITFMTSPILTLVSMCLLMSWSNYLFELQKETNSKTKLIRGVHSNKISCRQCTREMGEGHIKHKCGNINLNTHFTTVVSFELQKETKNKQIQGVLLK